MKRALHPTQGTRKTSMGSPLRSITYPIVRGLGEPYESWLGARRVLGILDCSKKRACDIEEDHAVTAVKQLDGFLPRFCSPLGPSVRRGRRRGPQPLACDVMLKAEIIKKVSCFAADGTSKEHRALALAVREVFP